jgi:hypothetical protein
MDLKDQFNYEDFCLCFARFLFPVIGADEIIAKGEFVTKLYRKCTRLYVIPENLQQHSKEDVCFRIGCEYFHSYTLYGETFKKESVPSGSTRPVYCTEPFKIVVRKDIKLGELEIIKHMKESFKANVLYLMRYTGFHASREEIKRLRHSLYKEKIYLVFYHEMNAGVSLMEDFGVMI